MRIITFSLLTVLLSLLSCDTSLHDSHIDSGGVLNALTISVQTGVYATKSVILSNKLATGSSIGLFVKNVSESDVVQYDIKNVKFTAEESSNGQEWSSERRIFLNEEVLSVHAYYPFDESITDISSIPVTTEGQTDYMYASNAMEVSYENSRVNIQMAHALSVITLNIKRGTYLGTGEVTAVAFQGGGIATAATLDAKTGNLYDLSGVADPVKLDTLFTMAPEGNTVHTLVIPSGVESPIKISLWLDGKSYYVVTPELLLQQGNRYEYNLTVDEGELSISSLQVGQWGYNSAGDPTLWAGGYSITLTGQMDSMAFFNEFKEDGSVRITAVSMSEELYHVSPVTCNEGIIEQTVKGTDLIIDVKEISKNMVITFDGLFLFKQFQERFYPAGTYSWTVPDGVSEVDVFIVGGGGGGASASGYHKAGSGGGYTKTFRGKDYVKPTSGTWMGTYDDGRDGDAIAVTAGQVIEIKVGAGGAPNSRGESSYFMNTDYLAEGGYCGTYTSANSSNGLKGGDGGSGGGGYRGDGGKNGGNGLSGEKGQVGLGQGHTTRDFGEPTGTPNAAGSIGDNSSPANKYGYEEGSGYGNPNSGYGGAGSGVDNNTGGGDGTVLIRYIGKVKR